MATANRVREARTSIPNNDMMSPWGRLAQAVTPSPSIEWGHWSKRSLREIL